MSLASYHLIIIFTHTLIKEFHQCLHMGELEFSWYMNKR